MSRFFSLSARVGRCFSELSNFWAASLITHGFEGYYPKLETRAIYERLAATSFELI